MGAFDQTATVSQRIIVTGYDDEKPYSLFCEPEGNELEVRPGDQITITLAGPAQSGFEVSWTSRGLTLCRFDDGEVSIVDKAGRELHWMRALKRRLSNIVYKTMVDDEITHVRTGPGGQRGNDSDASAAATPHTNSSIGRDPPAALDKREPVRTTGRFPAAS